MSSHIMLEKCQVPRFYYEPGVQPAPIGGPQNDKIVSINKYNVTNPVNKMLALKRGYTSYFCTYIFAKSFLPFITRILARKAPHTIALTIDCKAKVIKYPDTVNAKNVIIVNTNI